MTNSHPFFLPHFSLFRSALERNITFLATYSNQGWFYSVESWKEMPFWPERREQERLSKAQGVCIPADTRTIVATILKMSKGLSHLRQLSSALLLCQPLPSVTILLVWLILTLGCVSSQHAVAWQPSKKGKSLEPIFSVFLDQNTVWIFNFKKKDAYKLFFHRKHLILIFFFRAKNYSFLKITSFRIF